MAAATVLVVVAIVLPLIVPIYARTDPKWGDFPFFYWYLLISVPVVAILLVATNLLLRSKPTRDPAAAAGNGEVAK